MKESVLLWLDGMRSGVNHVLRSDEICDYSELARMKTKYYFLRFATGFTAFLSGCFVTA
jgi:hypothetical protein